MAVYKRGNTYWFNFTYQGKRYQQSTEVGDRKEADKIEKLAYTRLVEESGALMIGREPVPTIGQLLDALQKEFERRGIFNAKNKSNFKAARSAFSESKKASDLTTDDIERYIDKRQKEGIAPATINRAVGLISQAFKKAIADEKIDRAPKFPHLSEAGNARKGFFEADEFARLLEHLPEDLKDFCRFAYITGGANRRLVRSHGPISRGMLYGYVVRTLRMENPARLF